MLAFSSRFGLMSLLWVAVVLGDPGPAHAEANRDRNLSIEFSSERTKSDDIGVVVGTVTNKSNSVYPCVLLQFDLATRFDKKQRPSDPSRHLGVLSVEVHDVAPGRTVRYRKALPFAAGFGLKSVDPCAPVGSAKNNPPSIHRFTASPERVPSGSAVSLSWRIANADRVRLFENGREVKGRDKMADGSLGWSPVEPGWRTTVDRNTQYTLRGESRGQAAASKSVTVSILAQKIPCTITGRIIGRLIWDVTDDRGQHVQFPFDAILAEPTAGGNELRISVQRNGEYRFTNLQEGKSYRIFSRDFETDPREHQVTCTRSPRHLIFKVNRPSPRFD